MKQVCCGWPPEDGGYFLLRPEANVRSLWTGRISHRSWPSVPAFEQPAHWLREALRGSGARPELGLEMHSLFLDSGLPPPEMRVDAVVSGEPESPVYKLLAEAVRSLVPTLEKLNIASPADVQIDSLADRLREHVVTRRAVAMSYALIGAWTRKPSAGDPSCDPGNASMLA
jgi:hypothetical protein